MAESNVPKQDFAPHWLKFPPTDSPKSSKSGNQSGDRNRGRRDDPYYGRQDYNRLHRQSSFDFPEGKRHPPGPGKFRHHSVEDDYDYYSYAGPPYNYGYYNYNYEKYGMQYGSQPSLNRNGSRDGKYGRYPSMNGNYAGPFDVYDPYGPHKRGYYDKDHYRYGRDRVQEDRPFAEEFPSLNGEAPGAVKHNRPGAGVWDNPPKSNRPEESNDGLKNSSNIYKALVPNKGGQMRKNGRENPRSSNSSQDSSTPNQPNKSNPRDSTRQSPTTDLAIVTQPKKLGDKKTVFLRGLREDQNQNAGEKKVERKGVNETMMNGDARDSGQLSNGSHEIAVDSNENLVNGRMNGHSDQGLTNGEMLIKHVDHINLSEEDEEKRFLRSMGWEEEDSTEYEITDEEIRQFKNMVEANRGKKNALSESLLNAVNRKLKNQTSNGICNGTTTAVSDKENDKRL